MSNETPIRWLGLDSYSEHNQDIFYGRETEIKELSRYIFNNRSTIVFGTSGTGKTSLLRAGIFPQARLRGVFPIYIRLLYDVAQSPSQQIVTAIQEEIKQMGGNCIELIPPVRKREYLWEFLHRFIFFDALGERGIPMIVLDQFEEIFTKNENPNITDNFFNEIADLLNQITPKYIIDAHTPKIISPEEEAEDDEWKEYTDEELEAFIMQVEQEQSNINSQEDEEDDDEDESNVEIEAESHTEEEWKEIIAQIDQEREERRIVAEEIRKVLVHRKEKNEKEEAILSINLEESENALFKYLPNSDFHIVISMREDFLSNLERYSKKIPSLRLNRYQLEEMNGSQAHSVIMEPGKGIISTDVAYEILKKVTGKEERLLNYDLQNIVVTPSILSLLCRELDDKRQAENAKSISKTLVQEYGGDIINNYYQQSLKSFSPKEIAYLEDKLITSQGYRDLVNQEEIELAIKINNIRYLEDKHIIHVEERKDKSRWIEFTHDVLCKVAKEHKDARLDERQNMIYSIMLIPICLISTIASGYFLGTVLSNDYSWTQRIISLCLCYSISSIICLYIGFLHRSQKSFKWSIALVFANTLFIYLTLSHTPFITEQYAKLNYDLPATIATCHQYYDSLWTWSLVWLIAGPLIVSIISYFYSSRFTNDFESWESIVKLRSLFNGKMSLMIIPVCFMLYYYIFTGSAEITVWGAIFLLQITFYIPKKPYMEFELWLIMFGMGGMIFYLRNPEMNAWKYFYFFFFGSSFAMITAALIPRLRNTDFSFWAGILMGIIATLFLTNIPHNLLIYLVFFTMLISILCYSHPWGITVFTLINSTIIFMFVLGYNFFIIPSAELSQIPKYSIKQGCVQVINTQKKVGIIDAWSGKVIIPTQYTEVNYTSTPGQYEIILEQDSDIWYANEHLEYENKFTQKILNELSGLQKNASCLQDSIRLAQLYFLKSVNNESSAQQMKWLQKFANMETAVSQSYYHKYISIHSNKDSLFTSLEEYERLVIPAYLAYYKLAMNDAHSYSLLSSIMKGIIRDKDILSNISYTSYTAYGIFNSHPLFPWVAFKDFMTNQQEWDTAVNIPNCIKCAEILHEWSTNIWYSRDPDEYKKFSRIQSINQNLNELLGTNQIKNTEKYIEWLNETTND